MGYRITVLSSSFTIDKKKFAAALEAIKGINIDDPSWVNENWREITTFEDMMKAWRWEVICHEDGVIGIEFTGEKLGEDKVLFDAIAPYVDVESFIQIWGEDEYMWKWEFDGKECKEFQAKITWK